MSHAARALLQKRVSRIFSAASFTLLSLMMLNFTPQAFADGRPIVTMPAAQWSVVAKDGDQIKLSETGGALAIDYAVTIDSIHQVGNRSLKQRSFYLKLNNPVPVQKDDARILFEAFGHALDPVAGYKLPVQTGFLPVIEDASGELLCYTPRTFPHLKSGTPNWSLRYSPTFYTSEAGGATQDVYEAEGGDRNAWPDGALKFWGFRVDVRVPELGKASGKLLLGNVSFGPEVFGYDDPFFYLDGILKTAGEYRISATIRNRFQGQPLNEVEHTVRFDPADHATRRQRVNFQLAGDDFYWIDYTVRDAANKVVAFDSLRQHVWGRTGEIPNLKPVDLKAPPSSGHLRIAPGQQFADASGTGGVFATNEPMKLRVRVFPKGQSNLTLKWETRQMLYPAVIASGQVQVNNSSDNYQDLDLTIPDEPGRDAYRVRFTLTSGTTELDLVDWFIGHKTDLAQPRTTRTGRLQDRNSVKESTYQRTTYLEPSFAKLKSEDESLATFIRVATDAVRTAPYMTYMIDLRDFEVLPGVYDFALLDRVMDAAADRSLSLTVRLAHMESQGVYRWQPFTRQYSSDGLKVVQHPYGAYALTDKKVTDSWHQAYRALFDRYQKHPGFQGFYMMKPGGEWTVVDQPWVGVVSGYDPTTRAGFIDYMKKQVNADLAALNTRWNTSYKTWDAIEAPRPLYATGTTPDLRMQWLDFCRFKAWLDKDAWFIPAARKIREYAPNHVLIAYGVQDADDNHGDIDYYHNGGNHYLKWEGRLIDDWTKYRTGWITEPHHPHRWAAYGDPAERGWVLDWSTWIMTMQAGGGGANLHVYYMAPPNDLIAHYGGAFSYDRFEKFQPIMRELQQMTLIDEPRRVGTLFDYSTLFTKHRTVFDARTEDLVRWYELLKFDSVPFESIKEKRLEQYKLVLPNALDQVMSQANIQLLSKAVKQNGSKMIMTAITGQYCPELPGQNFPLLRELGIDTPSATYVRNQAKVTAQVVAENPLFKLGDSLKFFSQIDQQNALQSDLVKVHENFWQWPFRWIPQTDYFGYFPGHKPANCDVIARFADGGAAVTKHAVGKGEVIVFWGMPEYTRENYSGMMTRAETWAGLENPRRGNAINFMLEGKNEKLGRFYVLLYNEKPGSYKQAFPHVPDGEFFIDEMVIDQRLGTYTGEELRRGNLELNWYEGVSPLKILRLIPKKQVQADWVKKYRVP